MAGEAATTAYHLYPPPLTTYEDAVASRDLFMDTLKKLHISMGTKFMIPIVGGKELDLHSLFVEVTSRGGIAKVLTDRKWKDVTAAFNFPSSATNASFVLRKYYVSLIYHYEQIYFFKAKCWDPSYVGPSLKQTFSLQPEVSGVIDGKFDMGYLITVKLGSEELKGVLYQVPDHETRTGPRQLIDTASLKPRRKRRKKSEMRKRDPNHPKPNRSAYNFFFSDQHAKLKPHYHGRDREISRVIGESWNKLQEADKVVYQEQARKDKERYTMEMKVYREELIAREMRETTTLLLPLNPQIPEANLRRFNSNIPFLGASSSAYIEENEASDLEGYGTADKDSDFEECSQEDMELQDVNIEVVPDEAFDLQTRQKNEVGDNENKTLLSGNDNTVSLEDGISVTIERMEEQPGKANANESLPSWMEEQPSKANANESLPSWMEEQPSKADANESLPSRLEEQSSHANANESLPSRMEEQPSHANANESLPSRMEEQPTNTNAYESLPSQMEEQPSNANADESLPSQD